MKRMYLLSLWLLMCLIVPMQGQAVSQADLLNSERFEHIDSSADSGRGDGKYLDLSSVKSVTAPNGHRRIEASIYVSMPAANMIQGLSTVNDGGTYYNNGQNRQQRIYAENLKAMILPAEFGDEKYKLPNLIYEKAYGIAYDDEP